MLLFLIGIVDKFSCLHVSYVLLAAAEFVLIVEVGFFDILVAIREKEIIIFLSRRPHIVQFCNESMDVKTFALVFVVFFAEIFSSTLAALQWLM